MDINSTPATNEEWVAHQIVTNYSRSEMAQLQRVLEKLHGVAYKSWARDGITLNGFIGAVEMAIEHGPVKV